MQPDTVLAGVVDDLLRTDPRLLAAAPLIGRIAVLVTEPKPLRKPRKPKVTLRASDAAQIAQIGERLREATEGDDEPSAPSVSAPWLKVVKARKVSDSTRAWCDDKYLAELVVDGGSWAKLRAEDQRRALALALRGLRHEEREDGGDKVAREAPPLQCWPDTADDLSHLVAALGPDGAEGAAGVSAAERLGEDPANAHSVLRDVMDVLAGSPGVAAGPADILGPGLFAQVCGVLGDDGKAWSDGANEVCA